MKIKEGNRGFTLIELLVAISIAGAIMGVLSMTIITMMQVGPRNNDQAIVFRQVQNAGAFISRDAMMAQTASITTPGVFLSLGWTDAQGVAHTINYVFEGTTLKRQVDGGGGTLVAEYIDVGSTTASWVTNPNTHTVEVTVTIQASSGNAQAQRTYEVTSRVPPPSP